jgi:hypothetical protein
LFVNPATEGNSKTHDPVFISSHKAWYGEIPRLKGIARKQESKAKQDMQLMN